MIRETLVAAGLLGLLSWIAPSRADPALVGDGGEETAPDTHRAKPDRAPVVETPRAKPLCILKDGTRISGDLAQETYTLKTEYGVLSIPAKDVVEVRFGKVSDPEMKNRIARLIDDLGSGDIKVREGATEQLLAIGLWALTDVEAACRHADLEIRTRAEQIVEKLEDSHEPDVYYGDFDEVVTKLFTARGILQAPSFKLRTPFGELTVQPKDIQRLVVSAPAGANKTLEVTGQHTPSQEWCETGLALSKGDRLKISATGNIFFQNWGQGVGPQGNAQMGQRTPGVPFGALVGKIGKNGQLFLIGAGYDKKADKDGILFLACAAENGGVATGNFDVEVRVRK